MLFSKLKNILLKEDGEKNTKSYKIFFLNKKKEFISPWHNIPLKNKDSDYFNMICEVPKWTRKKMEINCKLRNNPVMQDIKNDKLREYKWGDMLFNYGAFPQTWEDPNNKSIETMKFGDDDPLDVIDIGVYQASIGLVYQVKILAVLAMIDNDETDWKIIAININDPDANKINNIRNIKKYKPGCLESIKHWLENYKFHSTGKKNVFAFKGKYKSKKFALKIIDDCHKMWKKII